jgi:fumarate hydratase subunit alpha
MTKEIDSKQITEAVKNLAIEVNTKLADDMVDALNKALKNEESPVGRDLLRDLIKNAEIARKENLPICQDTGFAIVFVELGAGVTIQGENLTGAINEGIAEGYKAGYLRKSIVKDPFKRENTGDNTPADIITEIVTGDKVKITLIAKGGGCENVSALKMFKPNDPFEEIEKFVVEKVTEAGGNPCPPIIVGLGIGGTADKAMLLAKKALLRKVGAHNSNPDIAKKERALLAKVNATGIGAGGIGGRVTALAANIETWPCHIASLPVALAVDCYAHRVGSVVI